MAHTIEPAKSGRAACRKCRQKIAKGELRFGWETDNAFSDSGEPSYRWFHLSCAAQQRPLELSEALAAFDGDLPERDELEKAIATNKKKVKPSKFPYAERAKSGRSSCIECGEKIAKDSLRVAVERELDTGSFVTTGAGYLHPGCAASHIGDDGLEEIKANSTSLEAPDHEELAGAL